MQQICPLILGRRLPKRLQTHVGGEEGSKDFENLRWLQSIESIDCRLVKTTRSLLHRWFLRTGGISKDLMREIPADLTSRFEAKGEYATRIIKGEV